MIQQKLARVEADMLANDKATFLPNSGILRYSLEQLPVLFKLIIKEWCDRPMKGTEQWG